MIAIAVLCLLLCGGVLTFALNPDMTSSLAQTLYGNGSGTEAADTVNGNVADTGADGNIRATLPNGMPGEQQTTGVNGDGTLPDENGGDGTTLAQQGNSLSDYINPNPQEPLRYPGGNTGSSGSDNTATPAPRSDAVTDLNSYYANCITQLGILGSGDQHFDNVVPKSLWSTIEQAYNTGAYEQGYVAEVLKKLGMENFVIQLQLVDLGDGYYRVYHNVVTY